MNDVRISPDTVTIYGASDDLIEVEGTVFGCDEYPGESAAMVVYGIDPAATRVVIAYSEGGVWAIEVSPIDDGAVMVPCTIDLGERYDGSPGYSARARFANVVRVEVSEIDGTAPGA